MAIAFRLCPLSCVGRSFRLDALPIPGEYRRHRLDLRFGHFEPFLGHGQFGLGLVESLADRCVSESVEPSEHYVWLDAELLDAEDAELLLLTLLLDTLDWLLTDEELTEDADWLELELLDWLEP